ncbi:MAG: hypothetical protein COV67_13700, partial [Nitrospinae bacterium CG11_big_fil_rev_8_21_14_0_20_56_8]
MGKPVQERERGKESQSPVSRPKAPVRGLSRRGMAFLVRHNSESDASLVYTRSDGTPQTLSWKEVTRWLR